MVPKGRGKRPIAETVDELEKVATTTAKKKGRINQKKSAATALPQPTKSSAPVRKTRRKKLNTMSLSKEISGQDLLATSPAVDKELSISERDGQGDEEIESPQEGHHQANPVSSLTSNFHKSMILYKHRKYFS